MHALQMEHSHNANLVAQFGQLAVSFKAWRPIRGDGNCYYRAVLFSWLERMVVLGNLDELRLYCSELRSLVRLPGLQGQVEVCAVALDGWIERRAKCPGQAEVLALLQDVASEFNKEASDYAMIICLRHLVAQYLLQHAHEPMSTGSAIGPSGAPGPTGDVLTYESWATAISGSRDMAEYCEQHVTVMHRDAADHVQHVCPRVLRTAVRICMVDRQTASCHFIDYSGNGPAGLSPKGSAEVVGSAAQLASVGSRAGVQPDIFLLLKPGHYDVLVARDDTVGRLLEPPPPSPGRAAIGATADASILRAEADARWRALLQLTRDACSSYSAISCVLEARLLREYETSSAGAADRASLDAEMSALLTPLGAVLRRFQELPLESPFAPDHRIAHDQTPPFWPLAKALPGALSAWSTAQPGPSELAGPVAAAAPPRSMMSLGPLAVPHGVPIDAPPARVPRTPIVQVNPDPQRAVPGTIGAALGVPCVLCFGEDGALKTLHCGYKAHVGCLKTYWVGKVNTLCRLVDLPCPAELTGCRLKLGEGDLRGVVTVRELHDAAQSVRDVDDRNRKLIEDLKQQSEEHRPTFTCAICLVDHEVEGSCTLPCQHRFCFESLRHHFDLVVRERRLHKLTCPAEGCGFNLRSQEFIHIFRQCLTEDAYHKLHEFLTRDNPNIYECTRPGCEERIFLDEGDDFADLACPCGHQFCGRCAAGPHPGSTCDERQAITDRDRKAEEGQMDAWRSAMALGWKPCTRRCAFGGGYKAQEECDHVMCQCGHEFCWDCGVDRRLPLLHDNRWHKPSCRYHTRPWEVAEKPVWVATCPACRLMPAGVACRFPPDDGYPQSYTPFRTG